MIAAPGIQGQGRKVLLFGYKLLGQAWQHAAIWVLLNVQIACVLAPRRVLCFRLLGGVAASFLHECTVLPTCVTTTPASMLYLKLSCGSFPLPRPYRPDLRPRPDAG